MVYKTEILNDIVQVNDTEEKVNFNFDGMNDKQKELFINYKREILRESIMIDSNLVKMDDSLMNALNSSNVELDLKKLNPKQTFLLDCCIKELERKIDPDVYIKHKQHLKRKRNNECASKFRKKRKSFEKINEIIRGHLNDLAKQCKGNLKAEQVEQIKQFLNKNKLSITMRYFDEDVTLPTSSAKSSSSTEFESSNASVVSSSSSEGDCNTQDGIEDDVQNMNIGDSIKNSPRVVVDEKMSAQKIAPITEQNSMFFNPLLRGFAMHPQYILNPNIAQAGNSYFTPVYVLSNMPLSNDLVLLNHQRIIS